MKSFAGARWGRWASVGGLLGATIVMAAPAQAQSIRCKNRIVSVGDTAYELRRRCGPAAHRSVVQDFRAVTVIDKQGNAVQQVVDEDVDVLTYPGERGDLTRIITVRRGAVASIRTVDRVVSDVARGCAYAVLPRRATYGQVHMSCGEPFDRSRWTEERAIKIGGQIVRRRLQLERWVYDPGPGRLLRILEFENGRLVNQRTGRRSPSRR